MDRHTAMDAFVKVVEAGSFSAAARLLGVGQPAVSKTIAQIEERLGTRLLLRSSRGLTLTEAGQNYFEHAQRALDEADEAELSARGTGAGLSGRLRVGGAVTFVRLNVVPRLGIFMARHPALDIDLVLDDRNVDLIGEGIDIALRMGVLADSAAFARKIGESRRVVVATPAYLARVGSPKVPSDLTGHEAIVYAQRGGGEAWAFRQGDTEAVVNLSGRIRTTAAEALREAVLASIGVAIATEWMFATELLQGTVTTVLDDWALPTIDLWAVFPSGRQITAKAHAFAQFVEDELGADGRPLKATT